MMAINITFVLAMIMAVAGVVSGYKTGLVKNITAMIFIIATFLMLGLGLYIHHNYEVGNVIRVILAVVCLVILGGAFGLARVALKALKAASNLPVLHLFDHLLGALAGLIIAVVVTELIYVAGFYNHLGSYSAKLMEDIGENVILFSLYKYNIFLK